MWREFMKSLIGEIPEMKLDLFPEHHLAYAEDRDWNQIYMVEI